MSWFLKIKLNQWFLENKLNQLITFNSATWLIIKLNVNRHETNYYKQYWKLIERIAIVITARIITNNLK